MGIGAAIRSMPGEEHCGDFYGVWEQEGRVVLCMIDGLGHGKPAEEAAQCAFAHIEAHQDQSITEILKGCGRAISHTRGAAIGIAIIDTSESELVYAGIGNTRTLINGDRIQHLPSLPGIVGATRNIPNPETIAFGNDDLLIMSSDGVSDTLNLDRYGSSTRQDVQILADRLMEDWSTPKDDACVLIYRYEA